MIENQNMKHKPQKHLLLRSWHPFQVQAAWIGPCRCLERSRILPDRPSLLFLYEATKGSKGVTNVVKQSNILLFNSFCGGAYGPTFGATPRGNQRNRAASASLGKNFSTSEQRHSIRSFLASAKLNWIFNYC